MNDWVEVSRLRRQLTALGGTWELTWSKGQLSAAIKSKSSSSGGSIVGTRPLSVRYYFVYMDLDRILFYDKRYLPGEIKLRVTVVCASSERAAISQETRRCFGPGQMLPREISFLKICVPVMYLEDLSQWRVEFEILHKFFASPILDVVARAWVDPFTLSRARGIDLFGVGDDEKCPVCMVQFADVTSSGTGIHLFRAVGIAVLFGVRCGKLLELRRKRRVQQTEAEVRFLDAKNSKEKNAIHMDIMVESIRTMNLMMKNQFLGQENETLRVLEARVRDLTGNVERLRDDVLKKVVETVVDAKNSDAKKNNYFSTWFGDDKEVPGERAEQPQGVKVKPIPERGADPQSIPLVQVTPTPPMQPSPPLQTPPTPPMQPSPSIQPPPTPSVPSVPVASPSIISDPAPSAAAIPVSLAPTAAVISAYGAQAASAFWTAVGDYTGGESHPAEEANIAGEIKEGDPPQGSDEKEVVVPTAPAWKNLDAKISSPVPKPPPGPKTAIPVKPPAPAGKKAVAPKKTVPKPPADPVAAKAALIATLKVMEAKRKMDIEKREKELIKMAAKLPPIDKFKFPGMPGPPPFKPKAPPVSKAVLPSVLQHEDNEEEEEPSQ